MTDNSPTVIEQYGIDPRYDNNHNQFAELKSVPLPMESDDLFLKSILTEFDQGEEYGCFTSDYNNCDQYSGIYGNTLSYVNSIGESEIPSSDLSSGLTDEIWKREHGSDQDDDNCSVMLDESELVDLDVQEWTNNCDRPLFSEQSIANPSSLPSFSMLARSLISPDYTPINRSDGSDSEEEDYGQEPVFQKTKRGAKNVLLWKFLLQELDDRQDLVQWIDMRKGVFKFIDTQEVSRLWGQKKRKQDMNFEKLSRGIRHYYKDGLMSRIWGTRLVYKFHWEKIPRQYRKF